MTKRMTREQSLKLLDKPNGSEAAYFRTWMPYLFQHIDYLGLKHVYLPLNRDYRPLGMRAGYADYVDHAETHAVRLPRAAETFGDIWFNPQPETGRFWLYNDSAASRFDYFERLQKLMCKGLPLIDAANPQVRRAKRIAEDRAIRARRKAARTSTTKA